MLRKRPQYNRLSPEAIYLPFKAAFKICCFIALTAWVLLPSCFAQDAYEIIEKTVEKQTGKSSQSTMTMQIIRPSWERAVSIKSWSLGTDHMLMLITAPARDAGTAFLKRKNEIWNWQPKIKRSIKLPPSMMTQSWMGSDFTNDDLVKHSSMVDDYTHILDGSDKVEGLDCHRIIMVPKEDAAVIWGKVIIWIDKSEYMQMKAEFYDEEDEMINTMYGREPKMMDGVLLPSVMEITPTEKPGHRTVISVNELTFNIDVDEGFFSEQQMKRIR